MLQETNSVGAENVESPAVSHDVEEQMDVDSSGSRDRGIPSCISSDERPSSLGWTWYQLRLNENSWRPTGYC